MITKILFSLFASILLLTSSGCGDKVSIEQGNSDEAGLLYDEAVELLHEEGIDSIDGAIDLFKKSVKSDPSFALAHQGLADAYILKFEFSEKGDERLLKRSIAHLDAVLELSPGNAKAYYAMSSACFDLGDEESGARNLKKALLTGGDDESINHAYLYYLLDSGNVSAAESFAASAPGDMLKNAPVLLALGDACQTQGDYSRAIDYYNRTLKRDRQMSSAHFGMGYCYGQAGDIKKAVSATKKYLSDEPDDVSAMNNLAVYYEELDKAEEAKKVWQTIRDHPEASEGYRDKAKGRLK